MGDFKVDLNTHIYSITQLEVLKAIEIDIPVWTFIARDVYSEHKVYQKNKDKDINYPSIDKKETAEFIFEFINLICKRCRGNNIFTFEYESEIENTLTKQFLGLIEKGIKNSKNKSSFIAETTEININLKLGKKQLSKMHYDVALECFSEAYKIKKDIIGTELDNDIIEITSSIAAIYVSKGESKKALEWCEKKLKATQKVYGDCSMEVAKVYSSKGYIYLENLGEITESLKCFEKYLEIAEKTTDKREENIAWAKVNLAHGYNLNQEFNKALECCLPLEEIADKLFENRDLSLKAFIYNAIGEIYSRQGIDYKLALGYLKKAKEIRAELVKISSTYQIHYSNSYQNLGIVYSKIGDNDTAIKNFNKCLTLRRELYESDIHPKNAIVFSELGHIYLKKAETELALESFKKALEIEQKNKNVFHNDILKLLICMADLYKQIQDYVIALEYLFTVYCVYEQTKQQTEIIYQKMELLYESMKKDNSFTDWLMSRLKVKNNLKYR